MKKWIFSMALIVSTSLSNASHQNMTEHPHSKTPQRFLASEKGHVIPDFIGPMELKVKGMQIDGFTGDGLEKLQKAFEVLEMVVNSEEFKDRVVNFKNDKGERQFASNKGLTNEEIFLSFMEGRERFQEDTRGEMNFFLKLYNRPWSKVIGYTNPESNVININWKFFKSYRPSDVAGNLAHEWTHQIGFDHKSAKEHDSAPYAIGYIVGELAEKMLSKNKLH